MGTYFVSGSGAFVRGPRLARFVRALAVVGLLLGAGLLLRPPSASALPVTIVVDRTDDTPAAAARVCSGAANDCSLRGAIMKANADPANTYNITFAPGANTYQLDEVDESSDNEMLFDLDILVSLNITGNGAGLTEIYPSFGNFRVFDVAPGAEVTISSLFISDGSDQGGAGGGAIRNQGILVVSDVIFADNHSELAGGAIANYGPTLPDGRPSLTVADSEFGNNRSEDANSGTNTDNECGGAIYTEGNTSVRVTRSDFTGNSGEWGGGAICQFGGQLAVTDSVFTNNLTDTSGITDTGGAAIYTHNGTNSVTRVLRSTFQGNASLSGGAIRSNSNSFDIENSTFVQNTGQNGGAVNVREGGMTIRNTTFAENNAALQDNSVSVETATATAWNSIFWGSDADNCTASLTDGGGNIDWTGDYTGTGTDCPGTEADPALQGLSDNGGYTLTMALGVGSAAIDAAPSGLCAATDQRGALRVLSGNCDSGAYETNTTPNSAPSETLNGDTITFPAALASTTIDLATYFNDVDSGPGSLTYEIVKNSNTQGMALTWYAPTVLQATSLTPANDPNFASVTVRATDPGGRFTDATFTIVVNVPPVFLAAPGNMTVAPGEEAGPFTISLDDPDNPLQLCEGDGLHLTATSDNQTVIPNANITLGGACESREISFTPIAIGSSSRVLRLVGSSSA